jgi:hypothetical protein
LRDSDRSTPAVSAIAYALESGTTAAASRDAPSKPRANSCEAAAPATGFRASPAWLTEFSGPVPPIAAAVAMMLKIETISPRIAPLTVSIRSDLYVFGVTPLSTTAEVR